MATSLHWYIPIAQRIVDALLYGIPLGNFNYVMHRKAKTHAYASFQRLVAIVLRLEEAGIRWQVYNHYNIIKFKAVVTKKTQDGVLRLMEAAWTTELLLFIEH